ncbi:ribonuclease P protein component [Paucibacter sp. APW11]|uniref:Ribonuclease P protein component n=1 Tax=Roseateles aquae TaxID=3077235 RepID=A0ABU3PJM5_9BURK|nr:ribonuclease P protein component [Paucibacter sp. APW11]MDT9002338.1 ribonuclease P protein component [Paucibacter sp. APW11]
MIGRIVRSADYERVLGASSRARSSHFAVHHLAAKPSLPGKKPSTAEAKLSTADAPSIHSPVDEKPAAGPDNSAATVLEGRWLGCVVPKRHARRSVTRSLLKRQIRAVFDGVEAQGLPAGLWVVRLRSPFDRKQFLSASSDALRAAARAELMQLVAKLTRPSRAAAPAAAAVAASAPAGPSAVPPQG